MFRVDVANDGWQRDSHNQVTFRLEELIAQLTACGIERWKWHQTLVILSIIYHSQNPLETTSREEHSKYFIHG